MRAGRLNRRIELQRKTLTQSASGQPIETWASIGNRWAEVLPVRGEERFTAPQFAASEQVEFRVRMSPALAGLTPLDRIVYPVPADASPAAAIPDTHVYDIMAVHEIGRREGLRIMAARRADTTS